MPKVIDRRTILKILAFLAVLSVIASDLHINLALPENYLSGAGLLLFGIVMVIDTILQWQAKEPLEFRGFTCRYEQYPQSYVRGVIVCIVVGIITCAAGLSKLSAS